MSKWYKITGTQDACTSEVLLEEVNGVIYERYVVDDANHTWKVTGDRIYHNGYDLERLKRFTEKYPTVVLEDLTEEDAFATLL